ncbi:hypothetical protein [Alsobacter metallidurans]|nr:hypothetical protein [Alsobacter metallidurans]
MSQATLDFPDLERATGPSPADIGLGRAAWAIVQAIGVGRVAGLAGAVALIGGVLLLNPDLPRFARSDDAPAATAPTEPLSWVQVSRPIAMFALDTTLLPREGRAIEARRHAGGGGREEIQSFGRPEAGQPFARLVAYRPGSEAAAPGSLFLDTARRAAEAGYAVTRSAVPVPTPTKFGAAESADVVLSRAGAQYACVAWRVLAEDADLRLSGWMCGGADRPADRLTLSCALDRLDLVGAGDDRALKAYFTRAERNRLPQCATRATPGGRRAGWLDADAERALRLRSHS